jgi:hypothetical protein
MSFGVFDVILERELKSSNFLEKIFCHLNQVVPDFARAQLGDLIALTSIATEIS